MYLTNAPVWLCAAGAVIAVIWPTPHAVAAWVAGVAALTCLDYLLAPRPGLVQVTRQVPTSVRLGEPTTATLTLVSTSTRAIRLQVRDAWPPSAGGEPDRFSLRLPAGGRRRVRHRLLPSRRGDRSADLVTLRSQGPLGLAGRQVSVAAPATLRVLPAFEARRHLPSRLARLREMDGRSPVMMHGAGSELDSLREYQVGDDVRAIDWRSTARRAEVLVRTWQPERDRRVIIVIDCGRLGALRAEAGTNLDTWIEATLLLATLAARAGDRVEVIGVDERLRTHVVAQGDHPEHLAGRLAVLHPTLTETDWALAAATVNRLASQHCLVVALTAIEPAGPDLARARALTSMRARHTVVVGAPVPVDLEQMRRTGQGATAGGEDETTLVYQAAAAEQELAAIEAAAQALRGACDRLVQDAPQALAPALADAYLDLKMAGRL